MVIKMKEIHMEDFVHGDEIGTVNMADIHEKEDTFYSAAASGKIYVDDEVYYTLENRPAKLAEVLGAAQAAGILAAKGTSGLIPMCHASVLTECKLTFKMSEDDYSVEAACSASCVGKKNVEMEALTGVSVALLTIFEMCKTMNRAMHIGAIRLVEQNGGQD